MNTSETLYRAADLIEERGWTSGMAGWGDTPGSGLCLEGAIGAAIGVRRLDNGWVVTDELRKCPAYEAVTDYLQADDDLWIWNDDAGRTQSEVVAVLRAAALVVSARESRVEVNAR